MLRAARTSLLLLAAALLSTCAAPPPGSPNPPQGSQEVVQPACREPQSPRRLATSERAPTSIVENGSDESWIYYKQRDGSNRERLLRCSHHYHCYIENHQPCNGNVPSGREHCAGPELGDWVEVHAVYAAVVEPNCRNSESLECCLKAPFVVRAYHAQVTERGRPDDPLPAPWQPPYAEWTGSNTGWDTPGDCKDLRAEWSFSLGCDLQVNKGQIRAHFTHPDGARVLQGGVRVSNDLRWVER